MHEKNGNTQRAAGLIMGCPSGWKTSVLHLKRIADAVRQSGIDP
jgi:hypothetical protein